MWFRSALAHSRLAVGVALLGTVLASGSLFAGLVMDDHMQHLRVVGVDSPWGVSSEPLDLFHFVSDENRDSMMASGALPWWSFDEVQIRFWRPLSAATHWLDYTAWPGLPALMHLHSLLWFGLALWLVARLYARLLSPAWVAGLAALLYAVDEAHGMTAGFLANRNALIATVAGALVLWLHLRWREDGWWPGAVLAPIVLGLGLLAGEFAIFAGAYLFAHAVCLDRKGPLRAVAALAPYALVVLVWRAAYVAGGWGAIASQAYIDPGADLLRFAWMLAQRLPVLLLAQWTPLSADLLMGATMATTWRAAGLAVLLLVPLGVVLASELWRDRTARFFALGMVLACVPVATTLPNDRLLLGVGVGAMGLVARFVHGCWPEPGQRAGLGYRVVAASLLLVHVALAPILLPAKAMLPAAVASVESKAFRGVGTEGLAGARVQFVNSPGWLSHTVFAWLAVQGVPQPRSLRQLSCTLEGLEVSRPDAHTLILRAERGLTDRISTQLMRPADRAFAVGQETALDGLTITVESLSYDGRPATARFRYDRALEDSDLRFLAWRDGGYGRFALPAIGEAIRLPPVRRLDIFF